MKPFWLVPLFLAASAEAADTPAGTSLPVPAPAAASAPAEPATVTFPARFSCRRFESKCSGAKCDIIAQGFRSDTEKKILTLRRTETVGYLITESSATETLQGEQAVFSADRQNVIEYHSVKVEPGSIIVLENKTSAGQVRERVRLDSVTGFYSYYLIHIDGTIKDIPIGEPFSAYFGWCDSIK